jgi:hypothetical protein
MSPSVTEVAVQSCLMDPHFVYGNFCEPPTTPEDDAIKGKWVRVDNDLNAQAGMYWLVRPNISFAT